MEMDPRVLLREQIERIEDLKHPPAYHPKYKIWSDTTSRIIRDHFPPQYAELLERSGPVRIAMDSEDHYRGFLENLEEKKQLLEGVLEESERLERTGLADTSKTTPPSEPGFHHEIEKVAGKLFEDEHYAQAVEESIKRVIQEVKRTVKDQAGEVLDGDRLMNRAFGIEKQTPIIRFNGLQTIEDQDEQRGMMYLFKGIVGIGNKKRHSNVVLNDPKRAAEYLALTSLLIRLLELGEKAK